MKQGMTVYSKGDCQLFLSYYIEIICMYTQTLTHTHGWG